MVGDFYTSRDSHASRDSCMGMVWGSLEFFLRVCFTQVVLAAAGGSNRSLSTVGDPGATTQLGELGSGRLFFLF